MADFRKIRTCLWFDNQAEQAAEFYSSVFKKSKVKDPTPTVSATRSQLDCWSRLLRSNRWPTS